MSFNPVWDVDEVMSVIATAVGQARWFTGKENHPRLQASAYAVLGSTATSTTILYLVSSTDRLLSIPLTFCLLTEQERRFSNVLGTVSSSLGQLAVSDATADPDGQNAILYATLDASNNASNAMSDVGPGTSAAHPNLPYLALVPHAIRGLAKDLPEIIAAEKLTSEQSNTSIIYRFAHADAAGSTGLILKVFRVINPGKNPDVQLQQALDHAGSTAVVCQYGSLSAVVNGANADLVVAQEFLSDALDAWQVMTVGLEKTDGTLTRTDDITALGAMTRNIHDELGRSFPTVVADAARRAEIAATWAQRAERAIDDAPELAELAPQIQEIYARSMEKPWPALQRIHGDYHLGQVLNAPGRGWVAFDFEGEPLRPLAQRVQPDLALRDVAGMLRSFDYAAGAAHIAGGSKTALDSWKKAAYTAFLSGYGTISTNEQDLLMALTLDKALYEVSYEVASRPDWVEIPLSGVYELLGR
ncbi:MAG: hypothetical protein GX483_07865 [Actinomycetaceae bacterium]|nr:hypothetical protein [Actinomycetaceae bacterium]